MKSKNEKHPRNPEERQASILVQALCAVGLVAYVIVCSYNGTDPSLFVLSLLGGGLLGVDNVMKFVRAIFRIGGGNE